MALKIRGNSQILDGSIDFRQMQDLSAGSILGRSISDDYVGKTVHATNPASAVELHAEDIRRISGLWELDDVKFNDLTLSKLASDQSGGDLIVEGEVNIGENLKINTDKFQVTGTNGNLETKGTMTSEGDIKLVDSNDVEQHALLATDGSLTSLGLIKSKSSIEINPAANGAFKDSDSVFSVDSNGDVIAAGIGDFAKTVTAGTLITLHGSEGADATKHGKIEAKLLSLDAGGTNEKLTFDSTGLSIDQSLTVGGDLTVNGTTTTIDTQNLIVEDSLIFLAKENNASDTIDIGFVGKYNNGTNDMWTGLVRDADVESGENRFKLFHTGEDLSTTNTVNTSFTDAVDDTKNFTLGHLEVKTLTATDLNGELNGNALTATSLAASVNFSIGDKLDSNNDVEVASDITAAEVSFDGSGNVVLTATIDNGVIDVDNFQSNSIVLSTEDTTGDGNLGLHDLAGHDNDTMIPTAAAVIDYVDAKVSSGGFTAVANMDLQMGYDNGFVRVQEKTVLHTVQDYQAGGSSVFNEETHQIVLINGIDTSPGQDGTGFGSNSAFDAKLDGKIMLFVNGQKLRLGDDATAVSSGDADFYINVQPTALPQQTGERSAIHFGADTIAIGDELEIKYYVKYS